MQMPLQFMQEKFNHFGVWIRVARSVLLFEYKMRTKTPSTTKYRYFIQIVNWNGGIMQIVIIFNVRCHPLKWNILLASQTDELRWIRTKNRMKFHLTHNNKKLFVVDQMLWQRKEQQLQRGQSTPRAIVSLHLTFLFDFDFICESQWCMWNVHRANKMKICVLPAWKPRNGKSIFDFFATIECDCKVEHMVNHWRLCVCVDRGIQRKLSFVFRLTLTNLWPRDSISSVSLADWLQTFLFVFHNFIIYICPQSQVQRFSHHTIWYRQSIKAINKSFPFI